MNQAGDGFGNGTDRPSRCALVAQEYCKTRLFINGFINHYPDIMIMTQSGKIILVEAKDKYLKNDGSQDKIELGKA